MKCSEKTNRQHAWTAYLSEDGNSIDENRDWENTGERTRIGTRANSQKRGFPSGETWEHENDPK
jgi:hypothetical protein